MEIVKAEIEDIPQILTLPDEEFKHIVSSGEKGEWVQWLINQATITKKMHVWLGYEAEKLIGYAVAMDNVMPPLSVNAFILVYCWPIDCIEDFLGTIETFVYRNGGRNLFAITGKIDLFKELDFKPFGIIMRREI
jgi:hypothetical protein